MMNRKKLPWVFGALIFFSPVLNKDAEGVVTFEPRLAVSERYTDNFFFTETSREGEYSTFVRPSFMLTYQSRAVILEGGYRGSLEIHARNSEANGYFQQALFGIDLPGLSRRFKNLDVRIVESFSFHPETPAYNFGDDNFEGGSGTNEGIQVARNDTFRNRAGIILGTDWSIRTRSILSYMNGITRYDSPILNDSTRHTTDLDIEYLLNRRTVLRFSYQVGLADYEDSDSRTTHRGGVGGRYQLTASFLADGRLGFVFFEDEPAQFYIDTEFTKSFKRMTLAIGLFSDAGQGGGESSTVTLDQSAVGRGTYELSDKFSYFIQGGFGRKTSIPGKDLETQTYEVQTGLKGRMLRWLRMEVRYSHFNQRALGTTGSSGTRNRVMLTLTATGPPWRVFK